MPQAADGCRQRPQTPIEGIGRQQPCGPAPRVMGIGRSPSVASVPAAVGARLFATLRSVLGFHADRRCNQSATITSWRGSFLALWPSREFPGGATLLLSRVRCVSEHAHLSRAAPSSTTMPDHRTHHRRRAGRPPAGAREGEKVKDYPQLSVRVPVEMKARLNALSAVTGLAQWRIIVEAIDCFLHDLPPTDRDLVAGLSERLLKAS